MANTMDRAYGTIQKKNIKIEDDMQIVLFGKCAERSSYIPIHDSTRLDCIR